MSKRLTDFLNTPTLTPPYVSYPLLPRQGIMVIAAPSKTYKSYIAMNLAYSLADGMPLFDIWHVKQPQRVLLIEQEVGEWRLKERLKLLDDYKRGKFSGDNLHIVSKDLTCQLDTESGLAALEQHIAESSPDVVILDPLRWFHNHDENDNTEMQQVMRVIYALQKKHNFSTIIIHHMGKKGQFRDGRGAESMRGASIVMANCDTFIAIHRPNERITDHITLDFTLRSAENPEPLHLVFNKISGSFVREHDKTERL